MNAFHYLLSFPWVQPLGWTLIHFLWQGALLGLVASVLFRLARRWSASARYLLACVLLASCAGTPLLTFTLLARPPLIFGPVVPVLSNAPAEAAAISPVSNRAVTGQEAVRQSSLPLDSGSSLRTPALASGFGYFRFLADEIARWIVPAWLVGVVMMGIRLGAAWSRIQIWRFTGVAVTDAEIRGLFTRLCGKMRLGNRVRLLLSDRVTAPLTLGWLRPVILLPTQILTGLSADELTAILAHELAHVARYDYLVNLFQSVLEVILFYHPVVWWLSRRIREIREECCDEAALRLGTDQVTYARALAGLAELSFAAEPALSASGGSLLGRIARLLGRPHSEPAWNRSHAAWALSLAGAFLVAVALFNSSKLMADPATPVANTKAAPTGLVVDTHDAPVAGARVLLYHWVSTWALDNRVVERVVTDANGRFALSQRLSFQTPNGTARSDHYIIVATHDGFAPAWTQILGGTPERKDLKLQLTAPVTKTVEVVDLQGKPVEGATVWLRYAGARTDKAPFFSEMLELPEDIGICHGVTDASGKVTLNNLPMTRRTLTASKVGFEDETSETKPTSPGGLRTFIMKPAATLEGRVTDPLGLPVEGAVVWLFPRFSWFQYFVARTDKDGRYRVGKIWSNGTGKDWGKYQVGIRDPRFAAVTRDVAFTSGQTIRNFDFSATSGTEIDGQLLDPVTTKPMAGASVYIDGPSGRQTRQTDVAGQFTCRVVSGDTRIFFGEPPGGTYVIDDFSRGFRSTIDTRVFGSDFPVTLYAPSEVKKMGTLSGKVIDAQGQPVAFGHVAAAAMNDRRERILTNGWVGNSWSGVSTDQQGAFTMTLPIGLKFTFTAQNAAGDQTGKMTADFDSVPLTLPSISLQPTQSTHLILTDLTGAPRPNLPVEITPLANGVDVRLGVKQERTDAQGHLHLADINPDFTYKIAETGNIYAWNIFDPKIKTSGPATLLISDQDILRVTDVSGRIIPISSLKQFFVWISQGGKKVRWTDVPPATLNRLGTDVVLSKKTIALGQPGDQIALLVEAEDGTFVRASGTLPEGNDGVILAKASELSHLDYAGDPSIPSVAPDEVAGRVVDPSGRPVVGATVTFHGTWDDRASSAGRGLKELVLTTDANGIFRLPNSGHRWFNYQTIWKEGFGPVFLTDLPIGKGFVVKLQDTTRLVGTVGGNQPGKVSILLEKDKDTRRTDNAIDHKITGIQFRTETDANGAYNFPIEPGTYRFTMVSADGRYATGHVTATADKTVAISAILQPGCPVTFQLTDCQTGKPVPGIPIGIMEQGANSIYSEMKDSRRTSDEQGLAHWNNLIPGHLEFSALGMRFSPPGQAPVSYSRWWCRDQGYTSYSRAMAHWDGISYAQKPPTRQEGVGDIFIDVKPGIQPLSILLEKGVKISGSVVGPDDAPKKGVQIGVVPNDGMSDTLTGDSSFTFITDEEGRFSGYIPAGNGIVYNLCAYYPVERPTPSGTFAYGPSPLANAVSEPFNSKPGDTLKFNLHMAKGGWITGELLGTDGKPTDGMAVTATNADRMDVAYEKRIAAPDNTGHFRVGPLRPGTYTVQAGRGPGEPLRVPIPSPENSKQTNVADGQEVDIGKLVVSPDESR